MFRHQFFTRIEETACHGCRTRGKNKDFHLPSNRTSKKKAAREVSSKGFCFQWLGSPTKNVKKILLVTCLLGRGTNPAIGGGEALETKESQQHQKQAEPHTAHPQGGGALETKESQQQYMSLFPHFFLNY